ncbi:MAG TPA: hypothetical protein VG168_16410 [Bryobacteraceae bacterium]|jgi:hypothetical protein|nr:hypothetical protein [Bryobacteraceae bacterium]
MRPEEFDSRMEFLAKNMETLHGNIHELWEALDRTKAIVDVIARTVETQSANITSLVQIAQAHENRIGRLEDQS